MLNSVNKTQDHVVQFNNDDGGDVQLIAYSQINIGDDSEILERESSFLIWAKKIERLRLTFNDYKDKHKLLCFLPVFIIVITLVQISVFFGYHGTDESDSQKNIWENCAGCFIYRNGSSQPSPLLFVGRLRHEVWRFLSYIFLHNGLLHLISNCIVQILVGVPLEIFHGSCRIACVYLLAVIAASLFYCSIDENYQMVGASAGVYALVFTHLSHVAANWRDLLFRSSLAPLTLFCVIICKIFVNDLRDRYLSGNPDQIAHFAHIIGAITGGLFGYFFL